MAAQAPPDRELAAARIARLPDHVIDQIAAGEVIERPASVVKELVENSLDAGATHVEIACAAGGAATIVVTDNGTGMSMAEAHLALLRHATSKLRGTDDLLALATHGFRGEALPSIASVSRMTLITRRAEDVAGLRLRLEGGVVVGQAPHGAPVGTSIEVRDLLFNQPARQKFLKSEATEFSHIADWVLRLALAHPEVGFRLRHNGREVFEVAPAGQRERVLAALGIRWQPHLLDVVAEVDGLRVRAHVTDASQAQLSARALHLFVGRRWVRDRGLAHAVAMAYGERLPRGRFPLGAVFLDLPPGRSDINVHPQKLEVRFLDASAVYAAVRRALRPVVDRDHAPISLAFGAPAVAQIAAASSVALSAAVAARYVAGVARSRPAGDAKGATSSMPLASTTAVTWAPPAELPATRTPGRAIANEAEASAAGKPRWRDIAASFVPQAVYWARFVVGSCGEGLVIIDMRRAVMAAMEAGHWRRGVVALDLQPRAVDAALSTLEVASFPALLEACDNELGDAARVLDAASLQGLCGGAR